ncbi:UNVERIFIED_CONTAM: hypothetical protein NCL1_04762 [Trichonephila clavipes]
MESKYSEMFFLAILSCIALTQASVPLAIYRSQPYKFRYGIKDHFSNQYRQEAGNGVGGVVGSYGGDSLMLEESPVESTISLTTPDSEPRSIPTNQEPPIRIQPLFKSTPMLLMLQEE